MDSCSQVLHEVQNAIVDELARARARGFQAHRLLDVGCWDGTTTRRYADTLGCDACGIEVFEAQANEARARGIEVAGLDLERDPFPWPDGSLDVVVVNQVFEHLKNLWLPMSECWRVLRLGGLAVVSVPNLASLHNRVLLVLGRQPTSIRTFGPHVRGFTFGEFRSFVAAGGGFAIERARGVGFYPLPARASGPACALWPGASHTTLVVGRKARDGAAPWTEHLRREREHGLQTHFA